MQKNGMLIPLITSVGVGAATYYSMTKNQQNFGQTMEKMVPLVSQLNGSSGNMGYSNQNQQMNAGNNMSSGNIQSQGNQQLDQHSSMS